MAFREGGRKRPPSDDRIQHGKGQSLHLKGVKKNREIQYAFCGRGIKRAPLFASFR